MRHVRIGLRNGPLFPNLIHLTPVNFGAANSQAVMGSQMAVSYIGIMLLPPVFGLLAQSIGTECFPVYILILFVLMAGATCRVTRRTRTAE